MENSHALKVGILLVQHISRRDRDLASGFLDCMAHDLNWKLLWLRASGYILHRCDLASAEQVSFHASCRFLASSGLELSSVGCGLLLERISNCAAGMSHLM